MSFIDTVKISTKRLAASQASLKGILDFIGQRPSRKRRSGQTPASAALEALEPRMLLTTIAGSSGDWLDANTSDNGDPTQVADGRMKLYVNGGLAGEAPASQLWSHTDTIGVGGANGATRTHEGVHRGHFFDGSIDKVATHNRALETNEIDSLFSEHRQQLAAVPQEGIASLWMFRQGESAGSDEAQGDDVADDGRFTGDATTNGALVLDGKRDVFRVSSSTDLNRGVFTEKTVSLWFKADDTDDLQVIYEQGGGSRGLNIYLDGDTLYAGGWNRPDSESDWDGDWITQTGIEAGEWNHVALTLDANIGADAAVDRTIEHGVSLETWSFDKDSEGLGETANFDGVWEFESLDLSVAETTGGVLKFKGAATESTNTSVTTYFDAADDLSSVYSSGVYEFSFDLTAFDLTGGSTSGNGINFGLRNSNGTNLLSLTVAEDAGNIQLEATHGALPGTGVTTTNLTLSQGELDSTQGAFTPVTITALVNLDLDVFDLYVHSQNGDLAQASNLIPFGFDAVDIASMSVSSSMQMDAGTDNFIEVDNVNLNWARKLIRGNNSESFLSSRPDFAGVWVNSAGASDTQLRENLPEFSHFLAGETVRIKWHTLKASAEAAYDFEQVGDQLQRAADLGYHWSGPLWTGQNAPDYVIENAGKIQTESVDRNGDPIFYPDYYSMSYREDVKDLIRNYADYLAGQSKERRDTIAILNPGFGSTGDAQLFSGNKILTPNYEHNSEKFFAFMKEVTLTWYEAFDRPELSHVRHMWKINSYDGTDPTELEEALAQDLEDTTKTRVRGGEMLYGKWMRENFDAQFRAKQFLIAIGPTAKNETNYLTDEERDTFFGETDIWDGNAEYVRGEFNDNKFANTPMGRAAIRSHYYWTAISGVDKGLDGWETKWQWLFGESALIKYDSGIEDPTEWDHFEFSQRYSFEKNGETAPVAFLAFRDVLDPEDTATFGTDVYGDVITKNFERTGKILADHWEYGAQNDDASAALIGPGGGPGYLENSQGLNDSVPSVFKGNFERFIQQADLEQGKGWWRVGWYKDQSGETFSSEVNGQIIREMVEDPHPYGRYARAFDGADNNRIDFKYSDRFLDEGSHDLKIKVTYYDEAEFNGALDWSLEFDNGESLQTIAASDPSVIVVDKGFADEEFHGEDNWKTVIFTVDGANFEENTATDADFSLINGAGSANDYKFHLIEVEVPSRLSDEDPRSGEYQPTIPIQTTYVDRTITADSTTRIQLEEYDNGGQGVAYFDKTTGNTASDTFRSDEDVDVTNSLVSNDIENGEWLEYTTDIEAGTYDFTLRKAWGGSTQAVKIYIGDSNSTTDLTELGEFTFAAAGQELITLEGIDLSSWAGSGRVIRIETVGSFFGVDWLDVISPQ